MLSANGFARNGIVPPLFRRICEISIAILILAHPSFGHDVLSIPDGNMMMRIVSPVKSPTIIPQDLPAKIVANNRFVVGVTFANFNLKKIYPYFSVDVQNAHNPSFHPMENHHLYSGVMLLSLGKITHNRYLKTIGTVMIIDDMIEHSFNIESALHVTANHVNGPLYARLTKDADRLFGR